MANAVAEIAEFLHLAQDKIERLSNSPQTNTGRWTETRGRTPTVNQRSRIMHIVARQASRSKRGIHISISSRLSIFGIPATQEFQDKASHPTQTSMAKAPSEGCESWIQEDFGRAKLILERADWVRSSCEPLPHLRDNDTAIRNKRVQRGRQNAAHQAVYKSSSIPTLSAAPSTCTPAETRRRRREERAESGEAGSSPNSLETARY